MPSAICPRPQPIEAEIAAATDEAKNFGRYVLAHAYTPEAITRAVNNGVRTIEHGNLIDDKSAKLLKSKGGYMIANLVTYFVMKEKAASFGMTADMLARLGEKVSGPEGRRAPA